MEVLVTGANGTLGTEVVAHLRALGHDVRPHDRDQGDLRDRDVVAAALAGVDAVVHAAAIPEPVSHPPHETFGNNVESTFHVLNLAGKAGVRRVVNISSASAFGFAWSAHGVAPAEVPVTDGHPYVGDDVYGLSKQVGELTAATASRAWDMTVVSLRFPFIGAGSRLARHLGPIHDDPSIDRNGLWAWIHTTDAARAVAAALRAGLSGAPVLTVAAPDTTALVPSEDLVRRHLPDSVVTRPLTGFETLFDVGRAYDLLGFRPEHGWR
jgi:nucleoside-diphosphate-sugar epimerase